MNRFSAGFIFLLLVSLPVYSSGEGIGEPGAGLNAQLPVSRVTLYTAGLAQMVHESTVSGDQTILFQVEPEDINDILKSLTIEDLDGGTVDTVNFDSSDPLSVVLGDLRVNPSGSPPLTSFLRQTQGETVKVTTAAGEFEGRIFSIEDRPRPAPAEGGSYTALNLMDEGGIRSVDISTLYSLRFTDPVLQNELVTALGRIADSRIKSTRSLKISFRGEGERRVRLSYIRAVPLWKTSYRIVLDQDGVPRLEGWAIVQNTAADAWKDIDLSFAAGQPNAFTMDLATPKYVTRQRADIASAAPIGPTAYERAYKSAPAPSAAARSYDAPAMAMADDYYEVYEEAEAYAPPPVAAQASGTRAGNFYRYDVKHPVTVDARSSAMIPIIQTADAGSSLGVYDPSYNLVFKGIRLENTTNAHWTSGPVTVLEGRNYGGDVLLPDMIPGSSRLLTYAVHGTLEVAREVSGTNRRITALKITDGILYRTEKMERTSLYRIDGDEDELLIIHRKESGWKLTDSPEIFEETPSEYRFSLEEWSEPVAVTEEYVISNQYSVINFSFNDIEFYMSWDGISSPMKEAFGRIAALKREVESIRTEINGLNSRINQITRDQNRIRENMKVLDKESELFTRYSDQLENQEGEITALYGRLSEEQQKLQAANRGLTDYITGLKL